MFRETTVIVWLRTVQCIMTEMFNNMVVMLLYNSIILVVVIFCHNSHFMFVVLIVSVSNEN